MAAIVNMKTVKSRIDPRFGPFFFL